MTEFDPERFEDKYAEYFPELQTAYRNAFEAMNDRYDSELVHAIDQQVLNESEPFYEGNGEFRVELPDDPVERVTAIVVEDQKLQNVLDIYAETIERELQAIFGFETRENAT
jgi:hypothetical protein